MTSLAWFLVTLAAVLGFVAGIFCAAVCVQREEAYQRRLERLERVGRPPLRVVRGDSLR